MSVPKLAVALPVLAITFAVAAAFRSPTRVVEPPIARPAVVEVSLRVSGDGSNPRHEIWIRNVSAAAAITHVLLSVRGDLSSPEAQGSGPTGWRSLPTTFEDTSETWQLRWRSPEGVVLGPRAEAGPFQVVAPRGHVLNVQVTFEDRSEILVYKDLFRSRP